MRRLLVVVAVVGLALFAGALALAPVARVPQTRPGTPAPAPPARERPTRSQATGEELSITITADGAADPALPVTLRCGARDWGQETVTQLNVPTRITGVPVGEVFVGARAEGFAVARQRCEVVHGKRSELAIALTPLGSVVVRVVAESGPVDGAAVELARQPQADTGSAGGPVRSAGRTSGDGTFSQTGLAAGEYSLSVRHPAYVRVEHASLRLLAGEAADRTVTLVAGVRFSGVLRAGDDTPMVGATVHVLCGRLDARGGGAYEEAGDATTDRDGRFVTTAAPAASHYYLRVSSHRGDVLRVAQHRCLDAHPGVNEVGVVRMDTLRTRFVAEGDWRPDALTLQGNVLTSDDAGPWVVDFHGLRFDANRVATVEGLPDGRLTWDLVERLSDGVERSRGSGSAAIAGAVRTLVVRLEDVAVPQMYRTPTIRASGSALTGGVAVLEREGALLWSGRAELADAALKLPAELPAGRYRAFVSKGDDFAEVTFSLPGATETPLEVGGLLAGRAVTVHVRNDGVASPGVQVGIAALGTSGRGRTLWRGVTDATGTFVIRGLPIRLEAIRVALMISGRGRQFPVDLTESSVLDVDERDLQ